MTPPIARETRRHRRRGHRRGYACRAALDPVGGLRQHSDRPAASRTPSCTRAIQLLPGTKSRARTSTRYTASSSPQATHTAHTPVRQQVAVDHLQSLVQGGVQPSDHAGQGHVHDRGVQQDRNVPRHKTVSASDGRRMRVITPSPGVTLRPASSRLLFVIGNVPSAGAGKHGHSQRKYRIASDPNTSA